MLQVKLRSVKLLFAHVEDPAARWIVLIAFHLVSRSTRSNESLDVKSANLSTFQLFEEVGSRSSIKCVSRTCVLQND